MSQRDVLAIGVAVATLQLMMLYILDALFSGKLRTWLKPLYVAGYGLLALIAVTFSFGFYWSLIEARHQSVAAAMDSVSEVQRALEVGRGRLQQLEQTFLSLSTISSQKGELERSRGGTCGTAVGPGPLQLREADTQRLAYAAGLVSQRVQSIQADIGGIDAEFTKLAAAPNPAVSTESVQGALAPHDRNAAIRELDRKLAVTVGKYDALRNDPQLLTIRDQLSKRAEQTVFVASDKSRFVCHDPQLTAALQGAARTIEALPAVSVQRLFAMEGEQATFEAFRRLLGSVRAIGETCSGLLMSNGREAVGKANYDTLTSRDYLPLGVAVFVDFCIFLIVMNRPWGMYYGLLSGADDVDVGELNEFLRLFHQLFVESHGRQPKTADLVRPLQDAVISHNGAYYGVAPLSFPEQRDAFSRLCGEARYVSNVLVALESRRLARLMRPFSRWAKMLTQKRIARKLKMQGSPFAHAEAFRLYRFAPQAWQGLVMRLVLNASGEREAGKNDFPLAEQTPSRADCWELRRATCNRSEREVVSVRRALNCIVQNESVDENRDRAPSMQPPGPKLLGPPSTSWNGSDPSPESAETGTSELTYDRSESQDVDYGDDGGGVQARVYSTRKVVGVSTT